MKNGAFPTLQLAILVVEDDPAVASLLTQLLEAEGYFVKHCENLALARQYLAAQRPDLALLDVALPDGSGFDLCREIRRGPDLPVIFLTGHAAEIDRVQGLELGAEDYVTKPFSVRELLARIRIVLRRAGRPGVMATPPPESPFGVDEQKWQITYYRSTLELSRTEFKILAILTGHPGWVFSRQRLMELVWADPGASDPRTVDAHIKSIRAKLREVTPTLQPIVTAYGVGYSLNDALPKTVPGGLA